MDIDFKKINELRQEIKKLIEERPELQEYQDFIDAELNKAGDNPHNRCVVLQNLMLQKRQELLEQLQGLQKACRTLQTSCIKLNKNIE